MMSKNSSFACGEKPSTSLVTCSMICGSFGGVLDATPCSIIARVRFSISGIRSSIFVRSPASVT